jgi:GNAT superfamily N-acetyltransferase
MTGGPARFEPIDLDAHADLCVQFRVDSYVCSFGTGEGFDRFNSSVGGYIEWLRKKMDDIPGSCVHVWRESRIIGQIELGRSRRDPAIGYVNLYYLVPEVRGTGVGDRLEEHVRRFFEHLGIRKARLSVSPSNSRAFRYYLKQGWKDLGPQPNRPEVHLMEKDFALQVS